MPGRWLTSVVLRHEGRATMFDCGEGTQVPLKSSGLGVGGLQRFVLSHLHADHVTGLPGLLMLLSQAQPEQEVAIVGLPEVTAFVKSVCTSLRFHLTYRLTYVELDPQGGVWPGNGFRLDYLPLKHSAPTLGFAYVEDDRPGKFDVRKARDLGVPQGPPWGELQQGRAVVVGDREIQPDEVLGVPRRGRRFAFVTDTAPCKNAYKIMAGADFAVIEAMFTEEHATDAAEKLHLTARQAGRIVRESGCRQAVIGHVSPRYREEDLPALEREAQAVCDRLTLARPLERYAVPLPD